MASKASVMGWAGAGVVGFLLGAAGDCYRNPDLGLWKFSATIAGIACFVQSHLEADAAEAAEVQKLAVMAVDHAKQMRMLEQEAQAELQANQVLAESKAEMWFQKQMGIPQGHTVDVPAQVPQTQAQAVMAAPVEEEIAAPTVTRMTAATMPTMTPTQPVVIKPAPLPDGAKLIEAAEVADINQYPVVMVVAVPGSGKTLTVQWVISQLPGKRVLCSHKAEAHQRNMYDIVFGYNPHTDESAWIGDDSTITTPDRDFTYISEQQQGYGTVADGYWSLLAEIRKRQKLGGTRAAALPIYRNFYDESAYAYSTAFQDPLNPELLRWGQNLVGGTNKITFFDARTNRNQIFFAGQSASVEIIGLKGLSAARDEMWFLYPGRSAIAYATQQGKQQLANWLTNRLAQGFAVALMVKQDVFWHVINMPKVDDLIAWENSFKVPAIAVETEASTDSIYDLVKQERHGEAA